MSALQVFVDGRFRRGADGPYQYATFVLQCPGRAIASTQVKVSDRAAEAFAHVVGQQKPDADAVEIAERLAEYLANKIRDRLDAGGSLEPVFEFLASPTQPGAFILDPIDVQIFIRQREARGQS